MYGTSNKILIVNSTTISSVLKFFINIAKFVATTKAKKNDVNVNSLNVNCNIVSACGSFSNGNILSVIPIKITTVIKKNIYVFLYSSGIFLYAIGVSTSPITDNSPIAYIIVCSLFVINNWENFAL